MRFDPDRADDERADTPALELLCADVAEVENDPRRPINDPGRVESVPLHPRPQHQQDRVHRVPVGHARVVTAERVRRPRRQQWLHPRPHLIRYPPTIVFDHETHGL